jgi:hypothetical protein
LIGTRQVMKSKWVMFVLVCALAGSGGAHATADDMFGTMFRMMLTMMNVMSNAMGGNNNWTESFSPGGLNTFSAGMSTLPMMSSLGAPFSTFGYSPFNTFGMSPWSGGSPWASMSPWSLPLGNNPWGNIPWGNANPWGSNSWGDGYRGMWPGRAFRPFSNSAYGYPRGPGGVAPGGWSRGTPSYSVSLLDGRWYGNSGEILEIRGNRFRLQQGRVSLNGAISIENDIVSMYSPQTNSVTRYTFMRNQTGLLLQDANGTVLRFTNRPVNGLVHFF